jgi:hypothetical protein
LRWKGLGAIYKKSVNGKTGFAVNARHLPITLAEAEAHDEYTDFDAAFDANNIKRLYIWDSFGREWNVSRKDLRTIRKEGAELAKLTASND